MKRLLFALMFVCSVFAVSTADDGYEPPFPEEYLPEGWFFTGESVFSVVSEDDRTAAFRAYCGKTEGDIFTFPSQCERKGETYTVVSLMDAPDSERYVIPATITQVQPALLQVRQFSA